MHLNSAISVSLSFKKVIGILILLYHRNESSPLPSPRTFVTGDLQRCKWIEPFTTNTCLLFDLDSRELSVNRQLRKAPQRFHLISLRLMTSVPVREARCSEAPLSQRSVPPLTITNRPHFPSFSNLSCLIYRVGVGGQILVTVDYLITQ